ncbi:substrate-binding periplasmic protein (plasmid) [Pseudoalteromonas sp. T1lg65]|uniref:substrate-binding periplasmic protein n=1 Tax=Pseudoalteromonas sp. T1lg65 TaxID=2077101 RepID=UPI003F79C26B
MRALISIVLLSVFVFTPVKANSDGLTRGTTKPVRVTILADESYPPYSYRQDGEMRGIYVRLVQQAASLIADEYEVEILGVPWKRGILSIQEGEHFAILPPYIHRDSRPYMWPYSVTLQEEVVVAFCNQGSSLKGLPNTTPTHVINVGLNAGYKILDNALKQSQQLGLVQIWENKDTISNVEKLAKGRIDCYVNDRISTQIALDSIAAPPLSLDISAIIEDKVLMRRTAHIGYRSGYNERFPYKRDFIVKMDQALMQVTKSEP